MKEWMAAQLAWEAEPKGEAVARATRARRAQERGKSEGKQPISFSFRLTPLVIAIALTAAACGTDSTIVEAPRSTEQTTTTTTTEATANTDDGEHEHESEDPEVIEATDPVPASMVDVPGETAQPDVVLEAHLASGEVTGIADRTEVALGSVVRITVEADIADEIHLHGYDITTIVTASSPVEFDFTADIPGRFEIEFEQSGTLITELVVS